jgi:hypothetical protein
LEHKHCIDNQVSDTNSGEPLVFNMHMVILIIVYYSSFIFRKNEGGWTLILDTYLFAMILNVNRHALSVAIIYIVHVILSGVNSHLFINVT